MGFYWSWTLLLKATRSYYALLMVPIWCDVTRIRTRLCLCPGKQTNTYVLLTMLHANQLL